MNFKQQLIGPEGGSLSPRQRLAIAEYIERLEKERQSPAASLGEPAERPTDMAGEEIDEMNEAHHWALQVLCRAFDDGADVGMEEWRAFYNPSHWLNPARALGAFIYGRLIAKRSLTPNQREGVDALQASISAASGKRIPVAVSMGHANAVMSVIATPVYAPSVSGSVRDETPASSDERDDPAWSDEYWTLDQAVLDATDANRTTAFIDRLKAIRDTFAKHESSARVSEDAPGDERKIQVDGPGDELAHLIYERFAALDPALVRQALDAELSALAELTTLRAQLAALDRQNTRLDEGLDEKQSECDDLCDQLTALRADRDRLRDALIEIRDYQPARPDWLRDIAATALSSSPSTATLEKP